MVTVDSGAAESGEAERLKSLLALHETALESMSHGLCMVDAEQRIVLYNQRFLSLFGLASDASYIGAPIRDMIALSAAVGNFPTEMVGEVYRRRLEMMARGKPFELRRQFSNGRTYSLFYQPMPHGGWLTLVEDVSERQRREYEMRVQFERFDQALTHMSHGLCMVDAEQRIVLFNQQFLKMYNLPDGVVTVGKPMRDVFEYGFRNGYFDADPDVVWQRRLERMAARKPFQQKMRLSGGYRYLLHYHPMDDGGWVTLCEDVTERERMQHELMLQYARFDQAVNHMSHGLVMFGADERLISCNARYIEMYGLDREAMRPGITYREVLEQWVKAGQEPGLSLAAFHDARRDAVVRGEIATAMLQLKDGRVIQAISRPTPDGGWVSAHEDVTERIHYEKTLREQNMLFDAALENMAHGLCMLDSEWRIIVHNRRFLELYGLRPEDVKPGTPMLDLVRYSLTQGVHREKTQSPEAFFEEFRQRMLVEGQQMVQRRFSDGRLIALRYQPLANGGGVCTYEDITERERAAEELKEQHHRFDVALNNMAHGLAMLDEDMRLIVCNQRFIDMFGLSPDMVRPGVSIRSVLEHSHALGNYEPSRLTVDDLHAAYVRAMRNEGERLTIRHLKNGRIIKISRERMAQGGLISIYEDITEQHRAEQSIAHMARHDALTDLPNRVLFRERMAEGLSEVECGGETIAVLCLDLDNFKGVNDTLGHPIGDRLLNTIAERIRDAVAGDDTVARLGGDEFAVLHRNTSQHDAEMLARRLVAVISEPVEIDGQEINSGVSIGIALAPDDGTAADHLMKCADLALYRAKAEGRATFRFFERDMDERIQARRALEIDLRRALGAGEFSLVYQPQISLVSNEITTMEALLRWMHPERGPVPPSEFIPVAEEIGLIGALGEWVLREACREAANWPGEIKVAVNFSAVQFRNRGLVSMVTHALASSRLSPSRLELEITEAVLLQDDDVIVSMLHQLRSLGVRISMDDFGTGYSSLSYLRSFPFDKIKIDRSFIQDIERNRDSVSIIRAIASLGASLGIETTAEGIETEEQRDLVRRAGCTEMQGYLVSRPVPAADLRDLIARYRRDVAAA